MRSRNPERAAEIEGWVDQIAETDNVIPMDAPAFRRWARPMVGHSNELSEDATIAATTEIHDLIVVTRNVRDLERLGARTLNPFAAAFLDTPRGS